ncbi:hypothetical protein [Roseivirga seohaensis]|uniref:hypothetical protein n=1 Tax=Roseivirga seohaensis TaxID=1914963 RepID=UPI003BAD75E9
MIISKPKRKTIFSLTVFTLISVIGSLYFMRQILAEPSGTWRYILLGFLLVVCSIMLYKLIFNYKVLKIGYNQIHVYYPFRFFKSVQEISELGAWQETIIHTNKTEYKQLKLVFINKGYVKISNQENSDYDKVYKYIKKKAPKKEVKE